jgi:hypothetical protein
MHANRATARARRPGRCRHASGHQGSIRRSGRSGRRGPRTDRPPLPDSSAPKCRASWYHGSSSTPYISSSRKTPRTVRGVLRRASSRARAASQPQHTLSLSLHSAHCLPPLARESQHPVRASSSPPFGRLLPIRLPRRRLPSPRPPPPAADPWRRARDAGRRRASCGGHRVVRGDQHRRAFRVRRREAETGIPAPFGKVPRASECD